jgi:hypothetical protein
VVIGGALLAVLPRLLQPALLLLVHDRGKSAEAPGPEPAPRAA